MRPGLLDDEQAVRSVVGVRDVKGAGEPCQHRRERHGTMGGGRERCVEACGDEEERQQTQTAEPGSLHRNLARTVLQD